MANNTIAWLQMVFMLVICAVVGTPQSTFSSIEHFMLNERIYEDRCTVLFQNSSIPTEPVQLMFTESTTLTEGTTHSLSHPRSASEMVYCRESREAYTRVYTSAGLGFALALPLALFAAKYFGFSVASLLCCSFLAAGSMVITSNPDERWLNDRMEWGYALVACAGPFALVNALNVAAFLGRSSRILTLSLVVVLYAAMQLSPLIWTAFSWQFTTQDLEVSDLFTNLLFVPALAMVVTLTLMPFVPDTQGYVVNGCLRALKPHFLFVTAGPFAKLELTSPLDAAPISYTPRSLSSNVFSLPFLGLGAAYIANSISADLLYVGGEARAQLLEEVPVWLELTVWAPLLAALVVPFTLAAVARGGVLPLLRAAYALCILLTVTQLVPSQLVPFQLSWLVSSLAVGAVQSVLVLVTTIALLKSTDLEWTGFVGTAFLATAALVKSAILPVLEPSTEFGAPISAERAYLYVLAAQLVCSFGAQHSMGIEAAKERREILELETELAMP